MAKASINGVNYNTNTAVKIGTSPNCGYPFNDSRWFTETLFRKKTGEFFLYGSGGALTRYADHTDPDTWEKGDKFIPLSEDQAINWTQEYMKDSDVNRVRHMIDEKPTPEVKIHTGHGGRKRKEYDTRDIIRAIQRNPSISQLEIVQETGMQRCMVVAALNQLRAEGKLDRVGSRRSGQWILTGGFSGLQQKPAKQKTEKSGKKRKQTKKAKLNSKKSAALKVSGKQPSVNAADKDTEFVIDAVRKNSSVSQRAIASERHISLTAVNGISAQLRNEGKITRTGTSRKGQWILSDDLKADQKKPEKKTKRVYKTKSTGKDAVILDAIKKNPQVTQKEMQDLIGLSSGTVYNILKRLKENGQIERVGTAHDGKWVIKGETDNEVITVFGMHSCPDCSFIEDQIKGNKGFRFVDIGDRVKHMKQFLQIRDIT